jgi:diguanylate cyclase (GGDEF)-like protein
VLAVGALALVAIGQVQVWISPDDVGFVYVLLIMVLYPLLTMSWVPAATVAVPMLMGCVVVASGQYGLEAADWVIASLAAVSIGMALVWLRLRSADDLAEKTALVGLLATRDQLTGVLNRHGIEERVPELVGLAQRHREQVFAVFADVDGLKTVNDTFGHATGDSVLVATADAIRETVRAADLVGRWGGDEFIVLGMGRGEHADEVSDRIREAIRASGLDPKTWPGGVSVGMATASLQELDIEALIRHADADMYTRRRQRRARGTIASAS